MQQAQQAAGKTKPRPYASKEDLDHLFGKDKTGVGGKPKGKAKESPQAARWF